jgi:hypothetical protein
MNPSPVFASRRHAKAALQMLSRRSSVCLHLEADQQVTSSLILVNPGIMVDEMECAELTLNKGQKCIGHVTEP